MLRLLTLMLVCLAPSVLADEVNLSDRRDGTARSAAQLVLAQRAHDLALTSGEVLPLLAAIRLARGVTLRPATGWQRVTTGEAAADAPPGKAAAADPGGEAALSIARNLAGEDPDLQDLVYDLDAQRPRGRLQTAVFADADLGPGQSDGWTLPLFGEVASEIALIGDGDGSLEMTVADATGAVLCKRPATAQPVLCRLTPARNGFFIVTVSNPGATVNSYRLIAN